MKSSSVIIQMKVMQASVLSCDTVCFSDLTLPTPGSECSMNWLFIITKLNIIRSLTLLP